MTSKSFPLPIEADQTLLELGARIALRRRMLQMTQSELARQTGLGLSSIVTLEQGGAGVAIGALARVLWALKLLHELDAVATVDPQDPLFTARINTVPKRVRSKRTR